MLKAQIYIKKHLKTEKCWGVSSPSWGGVFTPLGGECKNINGSYAFLLAVYMTLALYIMCLGAPCGTIASCLSTASIKRV